MPPEGGQWESPGPKLSLSGLMNGMAFSAPDCLGIGELEYCVTIELHKRRIHRAAMALGLTSIASKIHSLPIL